ncbi:unnamed protein product [Scytosiphon promiscuus]
MKKRLRPWTERMKKVWRRQQSEARLEEADERSAAENGSSATGVNGREDAWWEIEDDVDGRGNGGGGGGGGGFKDGVAGAHSHRRDRQQGPGATELLGLAAGVGAGERFRVGVRTVPIEALTVEDAAKMSAEEYTRFYNLVVGELTGSG